MGCCGWGCWPVVVRCHGPAGGEKSPKPGYLVDTATRLPSPPGVCPQLRTKSPPHPPLEAAWATSVDAPTRPAAGQGFRLQFGGMDDWMERAACLGMDTDVFYPDPGRRSAQPALAICRECPVRQECMDHALSQPEVFGVWGGATAPERRRMRRTSWV